MQRDRNGIHWSIEGAYVSRFLARLRKSIHIATSAVLQIGELLQILIAHTLPLFLLLL